MSRRTQVMVGVVGFVALVAVACGGAPIKPPGSTPPSSTTVPLQTFVETFSCLEASETWAVPAGVTAATIEAYGAQGGDSPGNGLLGGRGGRATAEVALVPGETLQINVGCAGDEPGTIAGSGGFPNGGDGSAGGGGSSDVRRGAFGVSDRLIVAGGGGGTGAGGSNGGNGGDGGGTTGTAGQGSQAPCGPCATGGQPGEQGIGGAGGEAATTGDPGQPGQFGLGGNCGCAIAMGAPGGGGGGGYYGGGGGGQGATSVSAAGGGGGGSGFGPAGTSFGAGVREGDGLVTITYMA